MLMLFGQDWVKYIGTCSTWHGSLQKTVFCNSQRLALNPLSTCNENGFASAEEPEMAGPRFLKRSKLWLILHQHKDQDAMEMYIQTYCIYPLPTATSMGQYMSHHFAGQKKRSHTFLRQSSMVCWKIPELNAVY